MSELAIRERNIPAMSTDGIARVGRLEAVLRTLPQLPLHTDHILHGGQYSRTIMLPAGCVLTGALIKVATTLTIAGDCTVYLGDEAIRVTGYNVVAASAGRKQAFVAHADTFLTMTFATTARTIEAAEDCFTDEAHLLLSRSDAGQNTIMITGE